ncbi:hypothetical protein ZWY2020_010776 [Hordeum vulgare]|nr:hypothetical protein ZWY2020_010776 [Hordeum vulgare]
MASRPSLRLEPETARLLGPVRGPNPAEDRVAAPQPCTNTSAAWRPEEVGPEDGSRAGGDESRADPGAARPGESWLQRFRFPLRPRWTQGGYYWNLYADGVQQALLWQCRRLCSRMGREIWRRMVVVMPMATDMVEFGMSSDENKISVAFLIHPPMRTEKLWNSSVVGL